MEQDFLLEVGTEEIPSSFLPQALRDLQRMAQELMETHRLKCGSVKTMGTPRRLTLLVSGLVDVQGDLIQEVTGPPRAVAFDQTGNPTKALEKFCARYGASSTEVTFVEKEKGEYVCLKRTEQGKPVADLLEELLPDWILSLPFPKSMRWGTLDIKFARPIHWILALYGSSPLEFRVGDVTSSHCTYGHRFQGTPGPLPVENVNEYPILLEENSVILEPEERGRRILEQSRNLSREVGGRIVKDDDLLQTLVFLTEYPVVLRGTFEERFLSLPDEVMIATMRDHQKYFALQKEEGDGLLPYFVAVANVDAPDRTLVQKGMERVLRARLEDARFFFQEDTKKPLEQNLEDLKQVIFHKKLGTSFEKVQRIRPLAEYLAKRICPEALPGIQRASDLCKADLVTQMVGEFPELQGVMGGIYASHFGEQPEVARAIREHYLPVSAEGDLPSTLSGAVLSLADKMDTVVGFFSIGTRVSGTSDPFGLRRRAIGILRILLDRGMGISLSEFIGKSTEILGGLIQTDRTEIQEKVMEFFRQRYQPLLLAKGFPHDTIDAVLSREFEDIPDLYQRIDVLHGMRSSDPDFEKLIIGCKRAVNILQQAAKDHGFRGTESRTRPEDFQEEAEKNLFHAAGQVRGKILAHMETKEYQQVLQELVNLKNPIDRFFDEVMVLVDDERQRDNRLGLLYEVSTLFQGFADFSKIVF